MIAHLFVVSLLLAPAEASTPDSIQVLKTLSQQRSRDGDVWFRLSEAYLEADSLEQASDAAKHAMRHEDSARALDLMGRIMTQRKAWIRNAPPYFRKALAKDPTFLDALYHLAVFHRQVGNEDQEAVLRDLIEKDPTYAVAYLDLGRFLFDRGENEGVRKAFETYLELRPESPDGYYGLSVLATEQFDYEAALKHGRDMVSVADDDPRGYAIVGQALAARGEHDEAADMFALYMWMITPEERAYYEDLSHVASKKELEDFSTTPLPARDQYVERFWKRHDPTLVTGGDIRKLEHYRRVWFARTYFGSPGKAWDRRGDVFVRYGEPAYRSRSSHPNALPPQSVYQVKEKMAADLYTRGIAYDKGLPDEVGIPVAEFYVPGQNYANAGTSADAALRVRTHRDGELTPGEYNARFAIDATWPYEIRDLSQQQVYLNQPPDLESSGYINPVFPVRRDGSGNPNVAWESWVYTDIGNGIEFVFTDEFLQGEFDFAPMPKVHHGPLMATAAEQAPALVYQKISSELPETFGPPPGVRPLDFYYDIATFKGKKGLTQVELYFGVPGMNLLDSLRTIRTGVSFHRKVAMEGQNTGDLIQESDQISLNKPLHLHTAHGGMYVSTLKLSAIPDTYKVGVQLTDRETGKWGLYMQDLVVQAYGDSLELSDLQVSSQASDSTRIEAFKKGDFWIVPAPSRMFPDSSSVFLYYEIYNMERDGMGMSDYTVSYTIREERQKRRFFGSLLRSLSGRGVPDARETTVTLDRYSWDQTEKVFFEVEPEQLEPGLKRVRVTILDKVSGREVHKEAVLWVIEDARAPSAGG